MKAKLLTSGQFAKACRTTKRTIHYYDEVGLLKPEYIDDAGYRHYEQEQIVDYQRIGLLRDFGFSIERIKEFVDGKVTLKKLFEKQKKDLEDQISLLASNREKIEEYIENLDENKLLIGPEIKSIEPFSYVYYETKSDYSDICHNSDKLFDIVKRNKIPTLNNVYLVVYKEKYFHPKNAKVEIGVMVDKKKVEGLTLPEGLNIRTMPKYEAVTYIHKGSGKFLSLSWIQLTKYMRKHKLKPRDDLYDIEIYWKCEYNGYPDYKDYELEIQRPIE